MYENYKRNTMCLLATTTFLPLQEKTREFRISEKTNPNTSEANTKKQATSILKKKSNLKFDNIYFQWNLVTHVRYVFR